MLEALRDLARAARTRLPAKVIGVTGSVGKTGTKDLTAAALAPRFAVHASPGSFNNEAGLPLTLLHAPDGTEAVVLEMGARFPGNIAELCVLARLSKDMAIINPTTARVPPLLRTQQLDELFAKFEGYRNELSIGTRKVVQQESLESGDIELF